MSAAANVEEYTAAAGKLQDFYAQHTPLLALYWDNMVHAHAARFENITIDYTFGINNVNNWFTISEK